LRGDDEDLDLFPPSAHGAVELVRLGPCGGLDEGLEFVLRGGGVGERAGAQQDPKLFFELPHGLQLIGRVIGSEDLRQAVGGFPGDRLAPARRNSTRCAQALSTPRPRRPLTALRGSW
jgi:hypothetical protein